LERKKKGSDDGGVATYLEVLPQLDNILVFQLLAQVLPGQVCAGSRVGKKASRLERLQERPRNSNVIAEAHGGAKWSVYGRRHFCRPYQIP